METAYIVIIASIVAYLLALAYAIFTDIQQIIEEEQRHQEFLEKIQKTRNQTKP
jgi:uncharacterized membrane protein (DUF106 family)